MEPLKLNGKATARTSKKMQQKPYLSKKAQE